MDHRNLMWKKIEAWCVDESKSGTLGMKIKQTLLPGRPLDPNFQGRIRGAKSTAFKVPSIWTESSKSKRCGTSNFNLCTGLFGGYGCKMFSNSTMEET